MKVIVFDNPNDKICNPKKTSFTFYRGIIYKYNEFFKFTINYN